MGTNYYSKTEVDAFFTAYRAGAALLAKYQPDYSYAFSYVFDVDGAPVVVASNSVNLLTLSGSPTQFRDLTGSGTIASAVVSLSSNNIILDLTALRSGLSTANVAYTLNKAFGGTGGPPYAADSWFGVVVDTMVELTTTTDN